MLMSPNKDKTAVYGRHYQSNMDVRMRKVLAIPRSWQVCFNSVHNLVSFPLPLNIAPYIYLCIDIQFGKKSITIQRHCNFFSIGWLFKSKVCYDKYGCFDRHPNLLVRFPQEPSKLGTSFLLFTRKNSQTAKIIDDSDVNKLRDSFFEISRRTIFLIHGFTGKIQLLLILKLIKLNIYY